MILPFVFFYFEDFACVVSKKETLLYPWVPVGELFFSVGKSHMEFSFGPTLFGSMAPSTPG